LNQATGDVSEHAKPLLGSWVLRCAEPGYFLAYRELTFARPGQRQVLEA
jgi:hypothetical protein